MFQVVNHLLSSLLSGASSWTSIRISVIVGRITAVTKEKKTVVTKVQNQL